MTQYSNQFNVTAEKGMLTLLPNSNVFNCKIDENESATLVPGDPVKIKDVAGPQIVVEKAAAATDAILGFVCRSIKQSEYVAEDTVQVAFENCVMVMEADAAIARGAVLEVDPSTSKVDTHGGTNRIVGYALDKAAADGDLIRVLIDLPGLDIANLTLSGNLAVGGTLAVTGDATFSANVIRSNAVYDSGAGALPLTSDVLFYESQGAEAITLADGVQGQVIKIIMTVDGGDGTLTPANLGNGSTLTFDDVGDSAELVFDGTSWWLVGTPTATLA